MSEFESHARYASGSPLAENVTFSAQTPPEARGHATQETHESCNCVRCHTFAAFVHAQRTRPLARAPPFDRVLWTRWDALMPRMRARVSEWGRAPASRHFVRRNVTHPVGRGQKADGIKKNRPGWRQARTVRFKMVAVPGVLPAPREQSEVLPTSHAATLSAILSAKCGKRKSGADLLRGPRFFVGLPAIPPCPDGHPPQPGGQKGGLRSPNIRGERRPCGTRTGGGRASGSLAAQEERVDLLEALCAPPRVDHHRAPRGPPREGCGGVKAGVRARWCLFKGRTVPTGRAGPCPAMPARAGVCASRECWKPAGFSTLAGVPGLRRAMS